MIQGARLKGTCLTKYKRTFSSARVLRADATTFLAISNLLPLNHIPFIYAIGIGSTIFGYLFSVGVVGADANLVLGAMHDYLIILEDINNYVRLNINNFNPDTLRVLLGFYQSMIFAHEQIFEIPLVTELLNVLEENSAMFDLYNGIFERWRGMGNELLEIFREIEGLLNISISNSRIPAPWYE